jgi:uncharacterized protein YndB with AHSA1/START domain
MQLDVRREIVIGVPRQAVWEYVADFRRHTEWSEPAQKLRIEPPSEVRVGATFKSVGRELAHDWHNVATITEVIPGERMEFVAEHDGSAWRNYFEIASDVTGGTRLVKGERFVSARFPMNILVTLLSPWLNAETRRIFELDLKRIKARLEDPAPRPRSIR